MVTTTISSILTEVIITRLNKKIAKGGPKDGYCHFIDVVLPIDKIDGVNTVCEIRLGVETNLAKTHLYQLHVCISIGTSKYEKKDDIFYKDMGMKSVKKVGKAMPCKQPEEYKRAVYEWLSFKLGRIQALITKLRVSPQRDCLTTKYEEESLLWEAKKTFCSEIEKKSEAPASIETSFKNCCVCDDETTHKTACKHHICIVCVSRLNKQKCPMCRSAIYDDEDDDGESDDEDDDDESVDENEDDYIDDEDEEEDGEGGAVENIDDDESAPPSLVSDMYNEN
jgi:hypothetical protein